MESEFSSLTEQLASDGLLSGLFRVLWLKAVGRNTSTLLGVRVPHTVVYRFTKPTAWYFLSKDGTLKKKSKKKLNATSIEQEILPTEKKDKKLKVAPTSNVSAVFLSASHDPEHEISCQYITKDGLHSFLQNCPSESGILQAFTEPKQHDTKLRNSMYTVNWTERACNIENVSNRHCIVDTTIPLHDRMDLESALSLNAVTNHSRKLLQEGSAEIARHLCALFRCKITYMTLHFRKDVNNQLWLLYCSNLRVIEGSVMRELSLLDMKTKEGILLKKRWWGGRGGRGEEEGGVRCRLCKEEKKKGECGNVQRRAALFSLSVLDHFSDPIQKTKRYEGVSRASFKNCSTPPVPKSVLMIEESMTGEEFARIGHTNEWLEGRVECCFDCLDNLVNFTKAINVDADGSIRKPFGPHHVCGVGSMKKTKSLRPLAHTTAVDSAHLSTVGGASNIIDMGGKRALSNDATSYGVSDVPASEVASL